MKCRKPNTDQEAELCAYANGEVCAEYVRPNSNTSEMNVIECYIAVKAGDRITLKGSFSGSVLQGSFDLVVDGSFLGDSHMEASHGQVKFYRNRKLEFKKALQCPIPDGWTSSENPKDIFEGHLVVKQLQANGHEYKDCVRCATGYEGVGSIAVIFSSNQRTGEMYKNPYRDITCGKWRNHQFDSAGEPHEYPELIMDIDFSEDEDKISGKRSLKHRRHQVNERFGQEPWAKFVFRYRTQTTINNLGCVPLTDEAQELAPASPGTFVFSKNIAGQPRKTRQQDDSIKDEGASSASSQSGRLFVSPDASELYDQMTDAANHCNTSGHLGGSLFQTSSDPLADPTDEGPPAEDAISTMLAHTHPDQFSFPLQSKPEIKVESPSNNPTGEVASINLDVVSKIQLQNPSTGTNTQSPSPPSSLPDSTRLPSIEDLEALFERCGTQGVTGTGLYNLFNKCGPYENNLWAQEEFQHRYQRIAYMEPHLKRWFLGRTPGRYLSDSHSEQARGAAPSKVVTPRRGEHSGRTDPMACHRREVLASRAGGLGALKTWGSHRLPNFSQNPRKSSLAKGAPKASTAGLSTFIRTANSLPAPNHQSHKRPRTQIEEAVAEFENELQEKLALQSAIRKRIRQHDNRHKEEIQSKREEATRQRVERLKRELAEADAVLENLAREERMKETGEWDWEDDQESDGSPIDSTE